MRALLLGMACAVAVSAHAQEVIDVPEGGVPRRFEIARDELFVTSPAGLRFIERVPAKRTAADLKREAARLQQARGGEAQLVLYEAGRPRSDASRRILTRKSLVVLEPGADPALLGSGDIRPAPALSNAWIVVAAEPYGALDEAAAFAGRKGVRHAEPLLARQQRKRLVPNDPLFTNQWHLRNTGQNGGTAGVDVRITNVWRQFRGEGIRIGIVDDGLQVAHPDLANADTITDRDFVDHDDDPAPDPLNGEYHGTACAGIAAASGSNALGVAGAAYRATLVGMRLTAYPTTDDQEAEAIAYSNDWIQIKSFSWGPSDDGVTLEGPGLLTRAAMAQATAAGRDGRGTLLVWAGGNGGEALDDSNKDGYANSIHAIAIGAVNDRGIRPAYSEAGANLICVAPSSADGRQEITTIDLVGGDGYNTNSAPDDYTNRDYTKTFGGTSASTPLAAGVMALMLQANPNLGWRDVKEILLRTSRQTDVAGGQWATNSAGIRHSHLYGAGILSASAAVARAQTWTNLGPHVSLTIPRTNRNAAIPDNNAGGVTTLFTVASAGIRVEHATVLADIDHTWRGDLQVVLQSPSGMRSTLAPTNSGFDLIPDFRQWTFSTVRHWGEHATGTWRVVVADRTAGETGTVRALTLTLHGTATGGSAPSLSYAGGSATASMGNANSGLDPGETIEEHAAILNLGATATNVSLTLTTTNPQVTILRSGATNALISTGATVTNSSPFVYRLSKAIPCGTVIPFTLFASYPGGGATLHVSRVVGAVTVYGAATNTFTSADIPKPISDNLNTLSTLTIAEPGNPLIDDIDVRVRINHGYVSDLQLAVRRPDGPELILANQQGADGQNFGSGATCGTASFTGFDDEAAQQIDFGIAPFEDSFIPENPLSEFDGKPLNGTWRFRATDLYTGDQGTVVCWSVTAAYHYESNSCSVYNSTPLASNLTVVTTNPAPVLIQLAGSDADGDPITFQTNAAPIGGTLSAFNPATGQITFTPDAPFCATSTFTYATLDGLATSAVATISVVVACDPDWDSDGDGMPDAWELQFFADLGVAGSTTDSDADGMIDVHEFRSGSVPTNKASLFAATQLSEPASGPVVRWQSHSNRSYAIDSAPDLPTGFTPLVSNLTATPPFNTYTSPPSTNALQLFRIRLE